MGSRRFAQRGHAGLASELLDARISLPRRRPPTSALVVAAVAAAVLLWSTVQLRGGDSAPVMVVDTVTLPGPAPSQLQSPSPSPPPESSLIDNALAKVQAVALGLTGTPPSSGLTLVPLTGEQFRHTKPLMGRAEARLIEVYQLISQARGREALTQAEALVRDHPNFQLAHLVLGDLLTLQTRPLRQLGDVLELPLAGAEPLNTLREESRRRLQALTERPPEGSVPTQFMTLAAQSRHAIAIDASRSRLYLFENLAPARAPADADRAPRLKLLGDYYISVGLSGIEKAVEGDKRTPLGVYYITSTLNPADLPDLYGVGALPINYPNPLDLQRGKTGSGIWLHGTPSEQFVRAPQASDGCVVLSNPDLQRLLATVQIRTTPVVIAPSLQWVQPSSLAEEREEFEAVLDAWRRARGEGKLDELRAFYSSRFTNQGRDLAQWWPRVENELRTNGGRGLMLKDLSLLRWNDDDDTMVVTFGEVANGQTRGVTKRQYWIREQDRWSIFFEGTI